LKSAITEILERAKEVPEKALAQMPEDFAAEVHESIVANMPARLRLLETANLVQRAADRARP
jgi:serine/threonine-protein kinase HipA